VDESSGVNTLAYWLRSLQTKQMTLETRNISYNIQISNPGYHELGEFG
jgi:hypothetical protein